MGRGCEPVSRRGYYLGAVAGVRILRFRLSLSGNLDENHLAGTQLGLDYGIVDIDCWSLEQIDMVADLNGKNQVPVRIEYIGIERWNIAQIAKSMRPSSEIRRLQGSGSFESGHMNQFGNPVTGLISGTRSIRNDCYHTL